MVPTYSNEFWTSRQRAASSLHEIPYRACFKPQLPRFFIERLTEPGAVVYDPFLGRGTTALESALMDRIPWGRDINPLSQMLLAPRLSPPLLSRVASRLKEIEWGWDGRLPRDLLAFFHPSTLRQICALRAFLTDCEATGTLDDVDRWVRMVAASRLTGHSPGFFSVYTLPPNQAVSAVSQRRINERRGQRPPARDVPTLILRKSASLLRGCTPPVRERLARAAAQARLTTGDAASSPELPSGRVDLVVTSPPFLNVVDYAGDNWLRAWFCDVPIGKVPFTQETRLDEWEGAMARTFTELRRLLTPRGAVAFEVGEVRRGTLPLEEVVIRAARSGGLHPAMVLINDQVFTKTAHVWGVRNRRDGTNTNRVVVLRRGSA